MAAMGDGFNPQIALSVALTCVSDNGDIIMDHYIAAYEQLNKLLNTFGTAALMATTDIMTKLDTMRQFRRGADGEKYSTVQRMVQHEVQHDITVLPNRPSGCRTLLRLHRALAFINGVLLKILDTAERGEQLAPDIAEVFSQTLGKFHPTVFVQYVRSFLPSIIPHRRVLVEKLGLGDSPDLVDFIQQATRALQKVYDVTQQLFADNGLLHLP